MGRFELWVMRRMTLETRLLREFPSGLALVIYLKGIITDLQDVLPCGPIHRISCGSWQKGTALGRNTLERTGLRELCMREAPLKE